MSWKEIKGAAERLALNANINNAVTSLVSSTTPSSGWPTGVHPFVIRVRAADGSNEEKMLCSARSGATYTVATRGYDGTSAISHSAGEYIEHVADADTISEANQHVNDTTQDNHTQYLNVGRHDVTARHAFGAALGTPPAPQDIGISASAGTAAMPARADHVHNLPAEIVQDIIGIFITAGTGISVVYSDPGNIVTIAISGATSGMITDFTEAVQDVIGAQALGGAGLSFTYNDAGNTLVLDVNVDNTTIATTADTLGIAAGIPHGVLGYAQVTAAQNGITGITDLTSLTASVSVRASSRIKISGLAQMTKQTSGAHMTCAIYEGATRIIGGSAFANVAEQYTLRPEAILTPSTGSHTYKLRAELEAGACDLVASATNPAWILVEDIGT